MNQSARPLYPPPSAPLEVGRQLYRRFRLGNTKTLVYHRGAWMRWQTTAWAEMDVAELRSRVYAELGDADYTNNDGDPKPWNPDRKKVADALQALEAIGHLSSDVDSPSWIAKIEINTPASQMVSCENGLLDLATRDLRPHTPALYNQVSVPFDYQPAALPPTQWLDFLSSVWPHDPDSIALLQEYFGYVVSGRTDMQKMLLLIGPTRSGKGTIARLVTELVGRGHVAGPTLASLGSNFGLSPLLGKPLAIVSDARLGGAPAPTVVERLLSITGEDMLTVDRKFKDPWSGRLPTRFMILSNELPRFHDSSGAIANRMLILQMTHSFLGREDRTLDERLHNELPGILVWALEGLDRLIRTGRFTVPTSSRDAATLMMDLASPVSAFVRDRCLRGPDAEVFSDDLYDAWKEWAEENGHRAGAKSTFGRDLRAVVPDLKLTQRFNNWGIRARGYAHIALLPVHPVHEDKSAVQANSDHAQARDASRAETPEPALALLRAQACTGCGAEPTAEKPLAKGLCTGCTGKSALKAQDSPRNRGPHVFERCPGCGRHVPSQGHNSDCPANTANNEGDVA